MLPTLIRRKGTTLEMYINLLLFKKIHLLGGANVKAGVQDYYREVFFTPLSCKLKTEAGQ